MAHGHDHSHDHGDYYVEQLCTIAVCGALGGVAVMLWWRNLLFYILAPQFHPYVLAGGLVLLALVAVRAVTLWFSVERKPAADHHDHVHHHHDHDHDHSHHVTAAAPEKTGIPCGHDHDHAHCDHDHDHHHDHGHHHHDHAHAHGHAHDHGWAPWRFIVLMLPVLLYFLGLPREGFSRIGPGIDTGLVETDYFSAYKGQVGALFGLGSHGPLMAAPALYIETKGEAQKVQFKELERASFTPDTRQHYQGRTVILTGQFAPGPNDKRFTLVRYKINCCAADAINLNAVIVIDPSAEDTLSVKANQWVQVTGRVQFSPKPGRPNEFIAVILVKPTKREGETLADLVKGVPPENNPYES